MNKNLAIKIRLSEDELKDLQEKANLVGYNKSKYIRSLIQDKVPKINASDDYKELINEFNVIAKVLTEIQLNNLVDNDKVNINDVINDLDVLIKKIDMHLRVPNK